MADCPDERSLIFLNPKIKKIDKEYAKNAEKITELQARQAELEKQRTELENLDIIGLVRSVGLTPDQLATLIHSAHTVQVTEPEPEESAYEEM